MGEVLAVSALAQREVDLCRRRTESCDVDLVRRRQQAKRGLAPVLEPLTCIPVGTSARGSVRPTIAESGDRNAMESDLRQVNLQAHCSSRGHCWNGDTRP